MTPREDRSRIDAQRQALQTRLGWKDYDDERKILHDTLEDWQEAVEEGC